MIPNPFCRIFEPPPGESRRHNILAIYCALKCWQNGWDGLSIDRAILYQFLGLEKLTRERVTHIAYDFMPWFPFHRYETDTGKDPDGQTHYEAWILFARIPISENLLLGHLSFAGPDISEKKLWALLMPILQGFERPGKESGLLRDEA